MSNFIVREYGRITFSLKVLFTTLPEKGYDLKKRLLSINVLSQSVLIRTKSLVSFIIEIIIQLNRVVPIIINIRFLFFILNLFVYFDWTSSIFSFISLKLSLGLGLNPIGRLTPIPSLITFLTVIDTIIYYSIVLAIYAIRTLL